LADGLSEVGAGSYGRHKKTVQFTLIMVLYDLDSYSKFAYTRLLPFTQVTHSHLVRIMIDPRSVYVCVYVQPKAVLMAALQLRVPTE